MSAPDPRKNAPPTISSLPWDERRQALIDRGRARAAAHKRWFDEQQRPASLARAVARARVRLMGTIGILNVGAGDTKLVFDKGNPQETAKSAAIVADMIRRGFVLLIEVGRDDKGPTYRRAHGFDPDTAEYIVAGPPPPDLAEAAAITPLPKTPEVFSAKKNPAPRRSKGRKAAGETRIKASSTNAVAVARTAGG